MIYADAFGNGVVDVDAGRGDPRSRGLILEAGVLHLAQDHALVDQLLKRLRRRHVAAIEQHLVPEARVEQVQHRMLGAADVEIDRQPVFRFVGSQNALSLFGSR